MATHGYFVTCPVDSERFDLPIYFGGGQAQDLPLTYPEAEALALHHDTTAACGGVHGIAQAVGRKDHPRLVPVER